MSVARGREREREKERDSERERERDREREREIRTRAWFSRLLTAALRAVGGLWALKFLLKDQV